MKSKIRILKGLLCLVLLQVPKDFGLFQIFCCHTKKWFTYFDGPKFFFQTQRWFTLMPCPFTGPKMLCAGPNFLSQSKNLIAFSASSKTFVPPQKPILLNANHLLFWHKMFVTGTMCKKIFGTTQNIWTRTKHFGTCKRTSLFSLWVYTMIF